MKKTYRWIALALLLALCLAPAVAQGASLIDKIKKQQKITSSTQRYMLVTGTFEKGDRGSDVSLLKGRLQSLGYYTPGASYDDVYNDTMVQRVELFQENNGLKITGKVDSDTLSKLQSSNPIYGEYYKGYWPEPDVTMIINYKSYSKWEKKSGDRFGLSIRTKNISTSRTVIATEYLVYTEDVWGDEIISKDRPYSYSSDVTYKPGEAKYSGYMNIPYRSDTHTIYIAVNKVRYSDGTVEYVSSPHYWNWDMYLK